MSKNTETFERIKAHDRKLWCSTQNNGAVIDAPNLATNSFAPPVIIESIKVDDEAVKSGDLITVTPRI